MRLKLSVPLGSWRAADPSSSAWLAPRTSVTSLTVSRAVRISLVQCHHSGAPRTWPTSRARLCATRPANQHRTDLPSRPTTLLCHSGPRRNSRNAWSAISRSWQSWWRRVGDKMTCSAEVVTPSGSSWLKVLQSFSSDNCVEVADLPDGGVGVRDSREATSAVLRFTLDEWHLFLGRIRQLRRN